MSDRKVGNTYRVAGIAELRRELDRLSVQVQAGIKAASTDSAVEIRDNARSNAPIDTGDLRDAIKVRSIPIGSEVGIFDPDVDYGDYLEFGTSRMPAQPFMTPAVVSERPRYPGRVTSEVRKRL